MKKYFYSFMGSLAAIWLSVLLGGLLIVLTILALAKQFADPEIEVSDHSVLRIDLTGEIVDRATEVSFMDLINEEYVGTLSLSDIVNSIRAAKTDSRIDGILIDCGGLSAGLAQCEEIIDAIKDFKKSGKWVVAYGDNYSQADYFIATSAGEIYANPVGMVDIHGLSATTFYFKSLLEKVGVECQVVKVGTYKSAVEPFLLDGMSEPNREQIDHFLGRIWDDMADSIAVARHTHVDSINAWANSFSFAQTPESYMQRKIIDHTAYRRQIDSLVMARTKTEEPQYVDFQDYCTTIADDETKEPQKTIAVLYAVGDITEDADDGIASDRLVPQILDLAKDDDIDGLVLRVNSGGGSAFASEQIWEALQQFKTSGKPFYVSMGDYAASGGYYISCGADKIYASPLTLTGSIGIFGIIPNVEPLMKDKLGVNAVTVETNTGNFPGLLHQMTPEQRDAMQSYVDRGYDLFVSRCAQSRGMTVEQIGAIAQGRVWDGLSALENGLVDDLGGLRRTLEDMAAKLGVTYADVRIVEYPEVNQNWWAQIAGMQSQQIYSALAGAIDPQSALFARIAARVRSMYPLQCRMNYLQIK